MFAINFGMSRSWAAVFHDGEVVIVPSAQGALSYVEFGKLEPKLCRKFTESVNAANSIYGTKRLLGRKFDDEVVRKSAKHSPMDIVLLEGRPAVQVDYHGEKRTLLMEQVVAMVLINLKEQVEKVVGHALTDVVLTVPHCFGDAQRRALKDAAAIAGLTRVRLLNDSTAAAITYAQRCEEVDRENVVVVDVGGGSTNVAVVEITAKSVKVKASAGCCSLGAEEFDQSLIDYCEDELRANHKIDVSKLGELARRDSCGS